MWWLLFLILTICIVCYFYKTRSKPIKIVNKVESLHELEIIQPKIDRSEDINKIYYRGLLDLTKKSVFTRDDFFLLNKVISDEKVDNTNYKMAHMLYGNVTEQAKIEAEVPVVRDDPQNVHDTVLNNELDEQVSQLLKSNFEEPEVGYQEYLKGFKDAKIDIFLKGAKTTYKGNNETDIYDKVWARINELKAIDSFVTCVKDCVRDDGYMHCTTGRVARVVSSLAVIDEDFGIMKNTDLLKQEALDKAAFVYENLAKNGDPSDEEIKEAITAKLNEDYSHINQAVLQEVINTCTNFVV